MGSRTGRHSRSREWKQFHVPITEMPYANYADPAADAWEMFFAYPETIKEMMGFLSRAMPDGEAVMFFRDLTQQMRENRFGTADDLSRYLEQHVAIWWDRRSSISLSGGDE